MAEDYVFLDTYRPTPFFNGLGVVLFLLMMGSAFGIEGCAVGALILWLFGWD